MTQVLIPLAVAIGALILMVLIVVAMAVIAYHVFGFKQHICPICKEPVRERAALDHGGDPTVYTHYGICAEKHAVVHADRYYT